MYIDPQKLPGVVPGDPHRPIPVLSSSNHTHESGDSPLKRKPRERTPSGFFSRLLPRPFTRALETLFGGRRRGELSGRGGDAEFFGPHGPLGDVWDDEMSSSMLGTRLRKVVQNYQVRVYYSVESYGEFILDSETVLGLFSKEIVSLLSLIFFVFLSGDE